MSLQPRIIAPLPRVIERRAAHAARAHAAPGAKLLATCQRAIGLGRHAHRAEMVAVEVRNFVAYTLALRHNRAVEAVHFASIHAQRVVPRVPGVHCGLTVHGSHHAIAVGIVPIRFAYTTAGYLRRTVGRVPLVSTPATTIQVAIQVIRVCLTTNTTRLVRDPAPVPLPFAP